ncbi:flagellar biosynthesis anti-sigma factor FlgM [Caproiciproducens sp. MSJ-32]|uniref:flagellar biosynthesis anti-sigma factor FlgM n=1 Tax=Caproiciproducens sp. MSJ-32 TaxID=2841527 RepID=UPI001C0F61FD|nr:flagellar biosynthesis anti-sigma factor FlgM [Caproiciproducens sp. MSJ-32]MBU5454620.1 flagellar biosynthesis anti-sigma factor FlgM [Caproiciproducens sp. MSJ-32]
MNIKGIGYMSGINQYNRVSSNKISKLEKRDVSDRIELSQEAKLLKNYAIDESAFNNSQKIIEIKNRIQNGTYDINSRILAQSLLDAMRGKE